MEWLIYSISNSGTRFAIDNSNLVILYLPAITIKQKEKGIITFQVLYKVQLIVLNFRKALRVIFGSNGVGEADIECRSTLLPVNHKEVMVELICFNGFFSSILQAVFYGKTIALQLYNLMVYVTITDIAV